MPALEKARQAKPPKQVWICYCEVCGKVDYAYSVKPKESGAGCPRCEFGPDCKIIAGPYKLVKRG